MKKIIITIGKNSQTIFLLIVLVIGLVILLNMIAFFYKNSIDFSVSFYNYHEPSIYPCL